jgi:hypothetical protein
MGNRQRMLRQMEDSHQSKVSNCALHLNAQTMEIVPTSLKAVRIK